MNTYMTLVKIESITAIKVKVSGKDAVATEIVPIPEAVFNYLRATIISCEESVRTYSNSDISKVEEQL